MIESLEIDRDGYPDDAAIDAITSMGEGDWDFEEAERFMRNDFARLAKELSYASVWEETVEDGDEHEIGFTTGGWSGCESFINAVLSVKPIRMMFYYSWTRGGRYTFRFRKKKND